MARGQAAAGRRGFDGVTRKTIIFHTIDQARAALAAAGKSSVELTLQSAPGAAVYGGVGYLKAIVEQAGADDCEATIDCGADSGIALAALRAGWKRLVFAGDQGVFDKLCDIAGQRGASVLKPDPDGVSLDLLDTPDPSAACRDFLDPDQ